MHSKDGKTRIRVLFVEDDPDTAKLVQSMLRHPGSSKFAVQHVADLKSALLALSSERFDVVLTDLNLPDSQAAKTVKRIAAVHRKIPIVVLSAIDDERTVLELLQAGAQEYMVKGGGVGDSIARVIRQAIERKRAEVRLQRLAHYDGLTGLANRTLFHNRLEHALAHAARRQTRLAVMVMDLDRFKTINDTLGRQVGDRLLVLVAERLRHCVREADTVARLGGDEFTFMLENLKTAEEAAIVAQKLLRAMSAPFTLEGQEIYVTPSVGITVYPFDDDNADGLMNNADAAMYRAKSLGRNSYQFFTADMNARSMERLTLEAGLRQALDRSEFLLHFQPRIDIQSLRLTGMEALLRWRRTELGPVAPGDFIPIAEETGLIIPIGEWVLREALTQSRRWLDRGLSPVRIAVNLSARQFHQRDVVEMVRDALQATGMSGEHLEVEITESVLMDDTAATVATLKRLKALGVRIAADDFGTGYCSLSYLKRFPIDALKIDRSFVSDITHDSDDAAIITAIIRLAHNLHYRVIAEGVETEAQLRFLREQRCDEAQGFLFSPPVDDERIVRYLQQKTACPAPLSAATMAGPAPIAV
ncbi:MAG: EAL domain-containing protein [Chromatiales bacterium]